MSKEWIVILANAGIQLMMSDSYCESVFNDWIPGQARNDFIEIRL